jgi:hypothetical protein
MSLKCPLLSIIGIPTFSGFIICRTYFYCVRVMVNLWNSDWLIVEMVD